MKTKNLSLRSIGATLTFLVLSGHAALAQNLADEEFDKPIWQNSAFIFGVIFFVIAFAALVVMRTRSIHKEEEADAHRPHVAPHVHHKNHYGHARTKLHFKH